MSKSFNSNSITELAISIAEGQLADLDHMFHNIYYYSYPDGETMSEDDILEMIDFYRTKQKNLIAAFKENLD